MKPANAIAIAAALIAVATVAQQQPAPSAIGPGHEPYIPMPK